MTGKVSSNIDSKPFDWNQLKTAKEPIAVGTNDWDADGIPARSSTALLEHTLDDGTTVKYREAAVPSPGGYMMFYRIPEGIDSRIAIGKLEKAEKLDTIMDGPAGLTKMQDHVDDAVDRLMADLKEDRKIVNSYKKAMADGGIIDDNQGKTLRSILNIIEPRIPTRQEELNQLNNIKTKLDLTLAVEPTITG